MPEQTQAEAARHRQGGNNPPLADLLKEQYAGLLHDLSVWSGAANRAPQEIADDSQLTGVGKVIVELRKIRTSAGAAHKVEKEPFLLNGRAVDAFFIAGISNVCDDLERGLAKRQNAYIKKKEDDERRRADEERQCQERAAAQLLAQAQHAEDSRDAERASALLHEAAHAEEAAAQAAARVEAKPAELVRTHSTMGVTVSAKTEWVGTITDYAKVKLDSPALRPYISRDVIDKAVRAAVKAGLRELDGVEIREERKATNRG